jgi:hypothetical protein
VGSERRPEQVQRIGRESDGGRKRRRREERVKSREERVSEGVEGRQDNQYLEVE